LILATVSKLHVRRSPVGHQEDLPSLTVSRLSVGILARSTCVVMSLAR
jgi:hypothetical protein